MDHNPPTTADYAASDAQYARNTVKALEQRIAALEKVLSAVVRGIYSPEAAENILANLVKK